MPGKRLTPCPRSPNCVSSQSPDRGHKVEPLRYDLSGVEAWQRVRQVVASIPRTRLVADTAGYLRFECHSAVLRFVDDVELLLDDANKTIHIRSASRTGHWDIGVNKKRVERIRSQFRKSLNGAP